MARGKEPHLPYILELAGLEPGAVVLDIGCGQGLVTAELADYLAPAGRYIGMDIHRRPIEKLRRAYADRAGFEFHAADVQNGLYNPAGAEAAEAYRFPAGDATVDLVILRSIFTHMLPAAVDHYLAEISRVLRPGGRAYVTYFLLNAEALEYVAAHPDPGTPGAFPHEHDNYRLRFADEPERAVALDEQLVRDLHGRHGLRLVTVRYGQWCGRADGLSWQDIVVAERH